MDNEVEVDLTVEQYGVLSDEAVELDDRNQVDELKMKAYRRSSEDDSTTPPVV